MDNKLRLIAITLPYYFRGEAALIAKMLEKGEYWRVHIRKPESTEAQMRELIEGIAPELRPRISLHDYHTLAAEYGIGGVHLNRRNPIVPDGWKGLVSKSIHSISEVVEIGNADYAFLSPIYPSISKPGYSADFDFEELRKSVNDKIFALGGVTNKRLAEIADCGFGGAAMLGAAWKAEVNMEHFRLQFITHINDRYDTITGAKAALEGGCRWVQLRMKGAATEVLIETGKELAKMCQHYGATFIIDDHVELVNEIGADGVHLGKNDMPIEEARQILGEMKIIGATANCFDDIEKANQNGANYIGLGPYRFTTTKSNLSPILGEAGYERIMQECRAKGIDLPVVAIGGIAVNDISGIMRTGVSGIALSGCILNAPDAKHETEIIINEINKSIRYE